VNIGDVASEEPAFRIAEGSGGGEILTRSEEAQIGKRVRVRKDKRTANLRGQEGTIAKRWGNPAYTALDVLLDGGNWQLFWYHELEEVGDNRRGARR
jgi:hypothetical protein